jgi:MoaA/NifB/PqqE/SkfB family radical SAM enzyme
MKVQKDSYLVLGYVCNQRCTCCPCSKESQNGSFVSRKNLDLSIKRIIETGITDVTLSGGEPTLHPDFINIVKSLLDSGIAVHILTNAEKFYNDEFRNCFLDVVQNRPLSITTTFHDHVAAEHEKQNGVLGSFNRSLSALRYLDDAKINLSIKHCITRKNYTTVTEFLQFFVNQLSSLVEFQLWGIDYSGLTKPEANEFYEDYAKIKPYLNSALNWFEIDNPNENQIITVNNIPLCACDFKYWSMFSPPNEKRLWNFTSGFDYQLQYNSGAITKLCNTCPVKRFCRGTYFSAFEYFGDSIVSPPQWAVKYSSFVPKYIFYDSNNIHKLFFSPFNEFTITKVGLVISNRLSSEEVCLRFSEKELEEFMDAFDRGICDEVAIKMFERFMESTNAQVKLEDLMYTGVIE